MRSPQRYSLIIIDFCKIQVTSTIIWTMDRGLEALFSRCDFYRFSHEFLPFQFAMGFVGLILASWLLSVHICFNRLNARNDYHLFRVWMRISLEFLVETGIVTGLSREKNRLFWEAEDRFNVRFSRILNVYLFVSCIVFPIQLFFVR